MALLLFMAGLLLSGMAQAHIQLENRNRELSLSGHLDYLSDDDNRMEFSEVLDAEYKGLMRTLPGFLNRGYVRAGSWLHFSVTRGPDFPEQAYLWIDTTALDIVDVYVQQGNSADKPGTYQVFHVGDHTPITEKPLRHPKFIVPIGLPDQQEKHVFIYIRSSANHGFIGSLLSADVLAIKSMQSIALQSSLLATILFLAIINGAMAIRLKDVAYGYYAAFLFSLFCNYLSFEGLLTLVFPGVVHHVSDHFQIVGTSFSYVFFSLFISRALTTAPVSSLLRFYLHGTAMQAALLPFFHFFDDLYLHALSALVLNGVLLIVVVMYTAWRLMRQGNPVGRLILLAFSVTALSGIVVLLRGMGWLPTTLLTYYAFHYSTIAHMILMTLALAERILQAEKVTRLQAQKAENEALALAESMTLELRDNLQQLETTLASEQRLRNEQSRFIDLISHEYRTPLTTLQTNLDILRLKLGESGPGSENISLMQRASQRLREIFNNSIHQSELNTHLPDQQSIHLDTFIRGILQEWSIPGQTPRWELEPASQEPLVILANQHLFKTVIINAIDNASKYSPPGSSIRIRLESALPHAMIIVSNELISPLKNTLDDLLDKYSRGSNSINTSGLGLGLHLIRTITEHHGGRVSIKLPKASQFELMIHWPLAPEHSSQFLLYLP